MECKKCRSSDHRTLVTNSLLPDQIVRKRRCNACGHVWFTAEITVPDYVVGWSPSHQNKPVLRAPVEVTLQHMEAADCKQSGRLGRLTQLVANRNDIAA